MTKSPGSAHRRLGNRRLSPDQLDDDEMDVVDSHEEIRFLLNLEERETMSTGTATTPILSNRAVMVGADGLFPRLTGKQSDEVSRVSAELSQFCGSWSTEFSTGISHGTGGNGTLNPVTIPFEHHNRSLDTIQNEFSPPNLLSTRTPHTSLTAPHLGHHSYTAPVLSHQTEPFLLTSNRESISHSNNNHNNISITTTSSSNSHTLPPLGDLESPRSASSGSYFNRATSSDLWSSRSPHDYSQDGGPATLLNDLEELPQHPLASSISSTDQTLPSRNRLAGGDVYRRTEALSVNPSSLTMGLASFIDQSSTWNEAEKMDVSTQQTERTREDEDDDDNDNSTIHSHESVQDSSATPFYTIPETHLTAHTPALGTPSTISTAPSTDDASFVMDAAYDRIRKDGGVAVALYHRRVPSWEGLPRQHIQEAGEVLYGQQQLTTQAWGQPLGMQHQQQQQQQRVATFRDQLQGFPPLAPPSNRWLQMQQQPTPPSQLQHHLAQRYGDSQLVIASSRQGDTRFNYPPPSRQPFLIPPSAPVATPPRTRNTRPAALTHSPQRPTGPNPPNPSTTGARSSSEILKTLLRKKACLYEPDTSRAVTLITWLVGRQLALSYGFFSRQQLQAGVHCCVAHKIDSGVITRTKVNRCMQIILNSCFHYIIPRPDGTEEKGDIFRLQFVAEVSNDGDLLQRLPYPWNDMQVDVEAILTAADLSTPQPSPQLSSINGGDKSPRSVASDEKDESKRAVLLCFNENVRSAEDVFRCHNEFIHDTAHAANLQLSSQEWRQFFGSEAAGTPHLWGNIGIPVPQPEGSSQIDAVGCMTTAEAAAFRTSWCAKRYDHNHELCGFAHAEINGGWLRRNPTQYRYGDKFCPNVSKVLAGNGGKVINLHQCPAGLECPFSHSIEEAVFHPKNYKIRTCPSANKPGGCHLGNICPDVHPLESYKFPKRQENRSPRNNRPGQPHNKTIGAPPPGAPILYVAPAPLSSFDEQILTPGLRSLYRRQCSVVVSKIRQEDKICGYSLFSDGTGTQGHRDDDVILP